MRPTLSGRTLLAAVVGSPVQHSLSPLIHNAWLREAGIDAVYAALSPGSGGFAALMEGLRGGVILGVNVTAPFKEAALAIADKASERAVDAGSANLLILEPGGRICADNTDGEGLLAAFYQQAPGFDPAAGPVVILGAGGAARGAAAAFLAAGAPQVRLINRTIARAEALARQHGDRIIPLGGAQIIEGFQGAAALVNTTPDGAVLQQPPPLEALPDHCVVMDMVYRPLRTRLLEAAAARGLRTVDGLAMLIAQAAPSFEALFGQKPPAVDVRTMALAEIERNT